jgi:hypothetical protein
VILDLVSEIVQIDHDLGKTVLPQELDDVLHHRAIYDRDQRLGQISREGVQPRTNTGRQNHGFHY